MIDTAILPIGGKGSRMIKESKLPKLLIKLNGFPLIYYSISYLAKQKIKRIIFISNNSSLKIEDYVSKLCSEFKIKFKILHEQYLRGNFGGILENSQNLPNNFLVIYPDIIWTCDLSRIFKYHSESQAQITLVVRRTDHPEDSDTIKLTPLMTVKSIYAKENKSRPKTWEANDLFGATGIYVINKEYLDLCSNYFDNLRNSIGEEIDLFQTMEFLIKKINLQISAYTTNEFIKDCGTPERFKLVGNLIKKRDITSDSYSQKHKVLFLDRDGTLIKSTKNNYLTSSAEVVLNDSLIAHYEFYTSKGYTPIVVTNQPQISFGILDFETLDQIHCKIQDLLIEKNLQKIFKFLICPHHPHTGYKNEITLLKFKCACRKPSIGMFNEVEKSLNVNKEESIMFGDTKRDEEFALNCGINYHSIK